MQALVQAAGPTWARLGQQLSARTFCSQSDIQAAVSDIKARMSDQLGENEEDFFTALEAHHEFKGTWPAAKWSVLCALVGAAAGAWVLQILTCCTLL